MGCLHCRAVSQWRLNGIRYRRGDAHVRKAFSHSDSEFLTPPESVTLQRAVESLADVRVLAWGGYEDADRRSLFILYADVVPTEKVLLEVAKERRVLS